MRVLAADIGGTNTRVQIFEGSERVDTLRIPTAGPSLVQALQPYRASFLGLDGAVLAVAGPVQQHTARLTNHPWSLDAHRLGAELGCPVTLVNDFEAAAIGVDKLGTGHAEQLSGPAPDPRAMAVVLGPGTGLGQAILLPGDPRVVHATEGGHVDLAPNTPQECRIWEWLHAIHGHVSAERVLSGPGLLALQHFFAKEMGTQPLERPAQVSASSEPASQAAMTHFARILGAHAGNMALALNPSGGVWIAGGIAPRLDLVSLGTVGAFHDKGRLSSACAKVPLMVVHNADTGLVGAGTLAQRLYGASAV